MSVRKLGRSGRVGGIRRLDTGESGSEECLSRVLWFRSVSRSEVRERSAVS